MGWAFIGYYLEQHNRGCTTLHGSEVPFGEPLEYSSSFFLELIYDIPWLKQFLVTNDVVEWRLEESRFLQKIGLGN